MLRHPASGSSSPASLLFFTGTGARDTGTENRVRKQGEGRRGGFRLEEEEGFFHCLCQEPTTHKHTLGSFQVLGFSFLNRFVLGLGWLKPVQTDLGQTGWGLNRLGYTGSRTGSVRVLGNSQNRIGIGNGSAKAWTKPSLNGSVHFGLGLNFLNRFVLGFWMAQADPNRFEANRLRLNRLG